MFLLALGFGVEFGMGGFVVVVVGVIVKCYDLLMCPII